MPVFKLHFRQGNSVELDDSGMEFGDLHQAYLEVCKAIPDTAREVLIGGHEADSLPPTGLTRRR